MKVKLEKELQNISDEEKKSPVDEVKLLLAGDGAKDLHIMRHLAGGSQLIKEEDTLGKRIELEQKNIEYGKTFTISQIEKLARKYYLRFLPSKKFKGKMDINTISKIKEFAKDYNVSCLDESSLSNKFFILAPAELFNMDIEYLKDAKAREREEMLRELDPVLFYKIDSEHYRLIHKWGTDFTIFRRIKGYVYDNLENYCKVMKVFAWIHFLILSHILYKTAYYLMKLSGAPVDVRVITGVMGIGLSALISSCFYYNLKGKVVRNDLSRNGRDQFFGKTNWNTDKLIKTK